MSVEFWTAFGSVGTLVVITATAIAAIIQVRHLRASNQALVLHNLFNEYEGPEYRDAFHFVRAELGERLKDPAFRHELRSGLVDRVKHPEITVLNFLEQMGALYHYGAIDKRIFMESFFQVITGFWLRLEPVIALLAYPVQGNLAFQNFERMTIDARHWIERHPRGTFAPHAERIPLVDPWRDADLKK